MDLKQRKLNKSEWNSIEIPVSSSEIEILNLITTGYYDVNIRINNNNSIFTFLKIEYSEKMEDYLYNKYFREKCDPIQEQIKIIDPIYKNIKVDVNVKINSADKIRLERNDDQFLKKQDLYENILLTHTEKMLYYRTKKNNKKFTFHFYTLYKLVRNNVIKINRHVMYICKNVLEILTYLCSKI